MWSVSRSSISSFNLKLCLYEEGRWGGGRSRHVWFVSRSSISSSNLKLCLYEMDSQRHAFKGLNIYMSLRPSYAFNLL